MIDYIFAANIDHRVLRRAASLLAAGGLVAFPTDSSWSIACSIESKEGFAKLRSLKGGGHFTPTVTCATLSQWSELTRLDTGHYRLVKPLLPGPYVFILESLNSFEKRYGLKRPHIGLRIPNNPIPLAVVETLGCPLFTITASRQMTGDAWWDAAFAEENLFECGYELEDIPGLDLILDTGEAQPKELTTVVDLTGPEPVLVRMGCAPF